MDKKKVAAKLVPYVEGSNKKTFHSAMMNVYFLYRRLLTITLLIAVERYPSLQITLLMIITLVNFIYTVVVRPYEENNIGEIMNESAILMCAYLMNVFFQTDNVGFLTNMGWVFIGVCC